MGKISDPSTTETNPNAVVPPIIPDYGPFALKPKGRPKGDPGRTKKDPESLLLAKQLRKERKKEAFHNYCQRKKIDYQCKLQEIEKLREYIAFLEKLILANSIPKLPSLI